MGKDGNPGGQATSSKDPKMQAAKVRLLDGTHKDFELHRGSDGEALFALVSADLSIEEREYFSLCFYDTEGTRHWLYNDKKILRQLKGLPWEFCFEVKFYPTIPSSLNDDHARYNLFLQLRNDVFTGRLPATIETHATLGSLVAQAEFGDAKPTAEYEQYLRTTKFAPQMSDQLIEMIAQKHKEHKGLTPAEAENLYMDTCKQQTMYGIFVFSAKDNKNVPVGIGICAHGIYIYKEQIRVNRFPWQGIIKISYRKAQFAIKLKAGEIDRKEATVSYKVADYQHAKRIWKCAVEHHTFFRLIQPDEKPKSSLFRWGSARFRYQGRTQFQTKMASQMFDKPSSVAVQRSSSARLTHSLDNVAREQAPSTQISPLHYADNELGSHEPLASPAVSYDVSGQNEKRKLDDKVGNGLPSDDDELVYTPVESPSSAAYYLSERSSACSPASNDFLFSQQMRFAPPHSWRATEHDRNSSGMSSRGYYICSESVNGSQSLPKEINTSHQRVVECIEKRGELEQRPINDSVHIYHPGYYQEPPHRSQYQINSDANSQRNGITTVRRLGPENEMDRHPIRYFVDVQHSGASHIPSVNRLRHPGKEELGPPVLSNYSFRSITDSPLQRLEPSRELTTQNIQQYSSLYHRGSSNIPSSKQQEGHSLRTCLDARVLSGSLPSGYSQHTSRNNDTSNTLSSSERSSTKQSTTESRLGAFKFWKVEESGSGMEGENASEYRKSSIEPVRIKSSRGNTLTVSVENTRSREQTSVAWQKEPTVTSHTMLAKDHENTGQFSSKASQHPTHRLSGEVRKLESTSDRGTTDPTPGPPELQSKLSRDCAQVYHHGQSKASSKTIEASAPQISETRHTPEKTAVLHLKTSPVKEGPLSEEESRKVRLIARVPHGTSGEEQELEKSKKEHDSSGLFGLWRTSKSKQPETSAYGSIYTPSEKYTGPLDIVNRQRDIDQLPFKAPTAVAYKPSADDSHTSHNRFNLFGRWRHEGDEETVEKDQVRPESYGLASTSYEGPLESTTRNMELQSEPLRDYAQAYHHGQSWESPKTGEAPAAQIRGSRHTPEKTAVLHLKTVKGKPSSEEESRKVRLIARVPHGTSDEEQESQKSKKEQDSSGLFGLWRTGKGKQREVSAHESIYPSDEKYAGPLDDINRERDIDQLPFKSPAAVAYKPSADDSHTAHHRFNLFGRWRHEGDEETVEKDQVRPESYGLASTSYEGPLESTTRHAELQSEPLRDYAQAHHHGQSWESPKTGEAPAAQIRGSRHTPEKTAVLHLKTPSVKGKPSSEEESRKVRLIARVSHGTSGEEQELEKPKKEQDSSGLFGLWRTGKGKQREVSAHESIYPSDEKYAGPLDDINRERDIDQLPFKSPAAVAYKPSADDSHTAHHRFNLFGRWRHEGDEETVEKDQVRPESYGLASTSYEGPLESTTRHAELQSRPLRDYAQAYHHGQSWETAKTGKTSAPPLSETKRATEKTGVLHLKTPSVKEKPSSEEESRKVRLIARVHHGTSDEEQQSQKSKKEKDSPGLFGLQRTKRNEQGEMTANESVYTACEKYTGPLNDVNRQRDIEQLPFKSPAAVAYKPSADDSHTAHHRFNLFGRWRHEGDEETVEKDQVRPESYGLASTSYEGPLESTTRHAELQSRPLRDYAQAYHHGQSWETAKTGKTSAPPLSETKRATEKTGVLHLKTPSVKEKPSSEEESRKVRLIARVPHGTSDEEQESQKSKKEQDSSGLFGLWRTGKGKQREVSAHESIYPSDEKYAGPLDDINRERDIDQLPFKSPAAVAYKPSADDSHTSHNRFNLFGRWRHEGDEETVEKDQVRPESYGLASTSYEGPLESTTRNMELQSEPLRDYAQAYHHGQSWESPKTGEAPAAQIRGSRHTPEKTAVLHLKTVKGKPSSEEESRKVRLIARVSHGTSGEEQELEKPKKEQDSSGLFGLWRTGKGKQREVSAHESIYPSDEKYAGPLDDINRERDIDQLPFKSPAAVAYKPSADDSHTAHHRFNLFGRWRHEGDEETVEKDQSRPLRDYVQAYHHGQSWETAKTGKTSAPPLSETKRATEKTGVLHLKTPSVKEKSSSEEESRKLRLIARVPHWTSDEEQESQKSKKEQDSSGLFRLWRATKSKQGEMSANEDIYTLSEKYTGPLDDVNRQRDIDRLPFNAPANVGYKPSTDDYHTHRHRFNLFGRWRHEGDEETVEKDQVRPESYGLASASYEGPLESTARHMELQSKPLRDYAQAYHHGQSSDTAMTGKLPSKTAVLHLKTSQMRELSSAPVAEDGTGKYRLIARVSHDTDTQRDVDKIQLKSPASLAYTTSADDAHATHHHMHLFGRWRHEGDEETVEKEQVRPESYGLAFSSYEGPLQSTTRHEEMQSKPLRDYAQAYHHGQSWESGKISKLSPKTAVLHLKTSEMKEVSPSRSGEETGKYRLTTRVSHGTRDEEYGLKRPKKEQDSPRVFSLWRTGKSKQVEMSTNESVYPSNETFAAPVDDINRQNDIDQLPFKAPDSLAYTPSADDAHAAHHHMHLFGRWRHEGDEETIEKDQVRTESYGLASTSYEGPLESTARQEELQSKSLRDYAQAYHHGQSWESGRISKLPSKTAVLHLKTSEMREVSPPAKSEEEKGKYRLIARIPHVTSGSEQESQNSRKEQDSRGLSGLWRTGRNKEGETSAHESVYRVNEAFASPLDDIKRQRDLDQIPFKSPASLAYTPSADDAQATHHRMHEFGRRRHEGDEETVEKDQVQPESYGIASTSYEGPLESTTRHAELQSKPLRDYAQAYHHGQSWESGKMGNLPSKTAVLHLKTSEMREVSPSRFGEETGKYRLIARIPHGISDEEQESQKSKKEQDSRGLFGLWRTGRNKQSEMSANESVYITKEKYAGPLDDVDRQRDIDQLPFKAPTAVTYKPSTDDSHPTHQRILLFDRWRHGGDEEVVDKDRVQPEAYGLASTSYEGPLESTARHSDLESKPLQDYDLSRLSREAERSHIPEKTSALHLNASALKEKPTSEEELRKIRVIARVHHGESEYEGDFKKPEKVQHSCEVPSDRPVSSSDRHTGRFEGKTMSGEEYVEVRVDRRVEIELEPTLCLTGAGLGALSEDEDGLIFSITPPPMPSSDRSFFSRLLFKSSSKKPKKQKKVAKEAGSSDSSSSSDDEKNQVHIMPVESGGVTFPLYVDPEDKDGKLVRRETNELKYHLKGEGTSPGFDPQNPESGQPHTTISTWQESSRLPDEVTTEYDEKGNKITRTLKTSQVKHTVQKQTFQNYVVPTEGQPGVVTVERLHEETTPLGVTAIATNGSASSPHVVETHSRSIAYEADPNELHHEGLGEFVSCKTLTSGNRTVETYTYKTERDGIIETHVEHRVTIHSDEPIDHDAELSQAIMEATQMNPDMTVEKIEVRQESTA
ncbi:hypothetical protein RB195_006370 [Necator americanus]|uniref:FERM domain-containing protein n=1 Tax=Necator americanus TaxID=51031 RepID=A0ABR1BSA8_NECAM